MTTSLSALPLNNALSLLPFLNYYEKCGYDKVPLLNRFGIADNYIQAENYIPTSYTFKIVNEISSILNIKNIGIKSIVLNDYSFLHPYLVTNGLKAENVFDLFFFLSSNQYLMGSHYNVWLEYDNNIIYIFHQRSTSPKIQGLPQGEYHRTIQLISSIRRFLGENWKPEVLYLASSLAPPHEIMSMTRTGKVFNNKKHGCIPVGISLDNIAENVTVGKLITSENSNSLDRLRIAINTFIGYKDLDLPFLSEIFGCSKRSIQRELKYNGTTFQNVLIQQKTSYAIKLLNEEISIINIAQKLGYSDPSNFSRAFKNQTGVSPSSYHKKICDT